MVVLKEGRHSENNNNIVSDVYKCIVIKLMASLWIKVNVTPHYTLSPRIMSTLVLNKLYLFLLKLDPFS